jgi:uncharacterized protein (TIGR03067 family)
MKIKFPLLALLPLLALVGCRGAQPGNRSADAAQAGPDSARLQGMWEIIEFRTARPGDGPDQSKLQAIRLTFAGDRLTISVGNQWSESFQVILDPTKDPKHMTVIEAGVRTPVGPATSRGTTVRVGTARSGGSVGPLERSEWIYKFEGDHLVIAVADPGAPRPTDFNPRGPGAAGTSGTAKGTTARSGSNTTGGRVDVIRLRKTTAVGPGPGPGYGTYRGTSFGTYRGTYRGPSTFRGTAPFPSTARTPVPTAKR